jgi:hypothetical protein
MTDQTLPLALFLLLPIAAFADTAVSTPDLPSAEQIVQRMKDADAARAAQLEGYTATRLYFLDNRRFHAQARIQARLTYRTPGEKSFEVLSEQGPHVICEKVLRRAISTEEDASHNGNRDLARINQVNYNLKVLGSETLENRTYFVLELDPKSKSPYLVKGKAWIDASEYALVKLEGVLSKKPSIWVGTPVIRQTYVKSGPFWLPEKNLSTTEAPVFGKTDLAIESSGYEIHRGQQTEAAAVRTGN